MLLLKRFYHTFAFITVITFFSINANAYTSEPKEHEGHNRAASLAIQMSSNSFGGAYYSDGMRWVFGFDMAPYQWRNHDGDKYSSWEWGLFGRKQLFKQGRVDVDLGLAYGSVHGKEPTGGDVKYSHRIGPYVFVEWEATDNFYLGGGVQLFRWSIIKVDDSVLKQWRVLQGAAVQLSYLFYV